jgi:POT family proton-dependent oligopeptide transporter
MPLPLSWGNHPKALYVLFFTEMWERFGFYLMLAIMDLFLMSQFGKSEADAGADVGTYMALVYLAPLPGGMLADRIGYRISILTGAFLLALGYFMFGLGSLTWVWISVVVLTIGNGLFKPNISTLVGNLYPPGDSRRDAAFGIFYMGINLGSLPSGIVAGYVAHHVGWWQAFAVAGMGMIVSAMIFLTYYRSLVDADVTNKSRHVAKTPLTPLEKERIRALVVMCSIVMVFWACFHQNATSLVVWAKDHTDLTLGGLYPAGIDPVYFASVNPFFVLTLTPVLIWIFAKLRQRNWEPTNPGKICLGMILTAISFLILVVASYKGGDKGRVSAYWLIANPMDEGG